MSLTNESTISDTESSSNLGRKVNVTGRVDQVDQEVVAVGLLVLDVLDVLRLGESGVQGDGSGLDCDTTYSKELAYSGFAHFVHVRHGGGRENVRSCSSARVSVARASPAFPVEMIPALARRESVRVDLP